MNTYFCGQDNIVRKKVQKMGVGRDRIFKKLFRKMEKYEINMEELKQKQQNGAIIIDVRSVQEYNEGHLNYAKNIPDYKINNNIVNIIQNKNQEIVLYCESGTRSKKAYKKLTKYGYTNVYNLYGGLENY